MTVSCKKTSSILEKSSICSVSRLKHTLCIISVFDPWAMNHFWAPVIFWEFLSDFDWTSWTESSGHVDKYETMMISPSIIDTQQVLKWNYFTILLNQIIRLWNFFVVINVPQTAVWNSERRMRVQEPNNVHFYSWGLNEERYVVQTNNKQALVFAGHNGPLACFRQAT